MSFINYSSREINCKIVYYGPGLCGKTTNLQYIYNKTNPDAKGKMISLATETERTLFFDFLPVDLGSIKGFKVRFHLYTVPGQVFYGAIRKLVLKGVDAIVFVADSQIEMLERNRESFENLKENLAEVGIDVTLADYLWAAAAGAWITSHVQAYDLAERIRYAVGYLVVTVVTLTALTLYLAGKDPLTRGILAVAVLFGIDTVAYQLMVDWLPKLWEKL